MSADTNQNESTVPTIKERLLARFGRAKEMAGGNWKDQLAASEPFFNTREGETYMRSVAQAFSNPARGHVDRIERVTLALERIVGIQNPPVA